MSGNVAFGTCTANALRMAYRIRRQQVSRQQPVAAICRDYSPSPLVQPNWGLAPTNELEGRPSGSTAPHACSGRSARSAASKAPLFTCLNWRKESRYCSPSSRSLPPQPMPAAHAPGDVGCPARRQRSTAGASWMAQQHSRSNTAAQQGARRAACQPPGCSAQPAAGGPPSCLPRGQPAARPTTKRGGGRAQAPPPPTAPPQGAASAQQRQALLRPPQAGPLHQAGEDPQRPARVMSQVAAAQHQARPRWLQHSTRRRHQDVSPPVPRDVPHMPKPLGGVRPACHTPRGAGSSEGQPYTFSPTTVLQVRSAAPWACLKL